MRSPTVILLRPLLTGLLLFQATQLYAQADGVWPRKSVRLIVPFAAAGPVDFSTRLVANRLTEQTGQTFLVDNRPGASGNLGAQLAANATPDGYTFFVTGVGPLSVNPHLFRKLPYDALRDFTAVTLIVQYPQVLAVSASLPVNSVGELIAAAKARPDAIRYGSAGVGTSGHLITETFLTQTGIRMTHVPFKGGSTTMQGMLTGDVQVMIDGLPSFMPPPGGGKIRVLAVSTAQRWPVAPEIPTIAEGARLPDFDLSSWVMFMAPTKAPREAVARFAAEAEKALKDEGVRGRMRQLGALPRGGTPVEAAAFFKGEYEKWRRIVEASGAKQD